MSIDRLQDKIRKTKNPLILDLDLTAEYFPPHLLLSEGNYVKAYARFCTELLEGLRGVVPAVRFSFAGFALLGTDGLSVLSRLLEQAKKLGYYVLLDVPEALTTRRAQANADLLFNQMFPWYFDGLITSAYLGSDAIKPLAVRLEDAQKSLFVAVRTGNRSAAEIQDLLTGGRHVFEAVADIVNRFKNTQATKSGYDRVAVIGPASSATTLRKLREKYKNLFILIDEFDSPSANAKNCAEAMDKLGHGAIVCPGAALAGAWKLEGKDGEDYVADAVEAAQRIKKNLARYVAVL